MWASMPAICLISAGFVKSARPSRALALAVNRLLRKFEESWLPPSHRKGLELLQSLAVSRLPESGRARVVTKRVAFGEPFNRERTFAPHWFTKNAERESARRFFFRGRKPLTCQTICDDVRTSSARGGNSLVRTVVHGVRTEKPHFATVPVSNPPKLSDSLVYNPRQVNGTFRNGGLGQLVSN